MQTVRRRPSPGSPVPAAAPATRGAITVGTPPPIPARVAQALSAHVRMASGIHVDPGKTDFLAFRVGRRLRALGLPDFDAYLERLERDAGGSESRHLVEALTTHTTSFFREGRQYEWLAETGLAELAASAQGRLLVWSAAASIGAELWSAAILLSECAAAGRGPAGWSLIGTDISERVLKRARQGIYTEEEIAGLSPGRRARFMMRARKLTDTAGRPLWRVVPELRAEARFARANLQDLGDLPAFAADIVFLRNVLIYFEPDAQARVVDGVVARMRPGAVLFTGHAEALGPHPALATVGPSIYRKRLDA